MCKEDSVPGRQCQFCATSEAELEHSSCHPAGVKESELPVLCRLCYRLVQKSPFVQQEVSQRVRCDRLHLRYNSKPM